MEITNITISVLAGVAGGFIGGVTGGAGIISIPAFIFLGLPANVAVATNTLTGFGIVGAALPQYHKARQVQWGIGFKLVPIAILGGFLGARELTHANVGTLSVVVGVLLLLLIPVVLLDPTRGLKPVRVNRRKLLSGYFLYFSIMVYGGFLGAGAGAFAMYALIYFFGMTYIQAKSTLSISTIFLCVTALTVFLSHKLINFTLGIPMTVGMYAGAGIGARAALKEGNAWVRGVFVAVALASAIKLLFFR